jgi:fucose 4-O-acetylase-like acetyltransferase
MPRLLPHSPISADPGNRTYVTRLAWVDRAKGIAIGLVVLHHVIQFSAELQWASETVIYWNTMLQTFRMPLFFAMSGLFFHRAASASWRWLMVNRVLPFLYLYGIWTAIWNVVFEMAPIQKINFGLRHIPALVTDPGVGPWYIFALVLYFIAAKALSPLPVWSQLALIAAVSVPVATHLVELPWAWQFISMYGLAFFAGMHGQRLLMRLADRTTWVTVLIAGGVWGVGTVGVYLLAWPFGRYLFIPLCAAGIALGVSLAAVANRATVLGWFGRRTLPIYLLHQPLIGAVYSIDVVRSLPGSGWVVAAALLGTWSAVVVSSIGIWRAGRIIPGLFVAPWYGAGNATMSRASANAPQFSTDSRSPGDGPR